MGGVVGLMMLLLLLKVFGPLEGDDVGVELEW